MGVAVGSTHTPSTNPTGDVGRARELADRYTATELAFLLAGNEALVNAQQDRIKRYRQALSEIITGGWTAQGAVDVARKGLHWAVSASTGDGP